MSCIRDAFSGFAASVDLASSAAPSISLEQVKAWQQTCHQLVSVPSHGHLVTEQDRSTCRAGVPLRSPFKASEPFYHQCLTWSQQYDVAIAARPPSPLPALCVSYLAAR